MRISDQNIQQLKVILKQQYGMECNNERAQAAGRAILRLVGIKLYQEFEKEAQHGKAKQPTVSAIHV